LGVTDEHVRQEPANGGIWFGPRLRYRDRKSHVTDKQAKQESTNGGMWFGPRLEPETMNRPPHYGFLPQHGKDAFAEIYSTAVNNIIKSELDNYSSQISDDIGIMKYSKSDRIQFASYLSDTEKKQPK
jgi:hypothetical protein